MKNKLVSSFLGGFLGILLSGYVYYLSDKHYFLLVPLGIFCGSLVGFFWFNFREIMSKALAFSQSFLKKKPIKILKPFLQLLAWISSIRIRVKAKDFFNFFIIIFQVLRSFIRAIRLPFKKAIDWIRSHPMNFYLLQEIIVILVVSLGSLVFLIRLDILSETMSVPSLIICLALCGAIAGPSILIFDRGVRTFYSDWQFYSRFGFLGVVLKSISRFLFFAISTSVIFTAILAGIMLFVLYGIALLLLTFLFLGFTSVFVYVLRLASNQRELASLIITMIVTFISYYIYRNSFIEEFIIWLVAFGTGSVSSLAVWLALSFDKGWIINRLEQAYSFLSNDESDMEKIVTYRQSWTGVMVFSPGNWVIKNIYQRMVSVGEYLGDLVNLKMR
ncbi:MAG: hypothetical protein RBT30_02180 [Patescibacteria group bacterium]|jgi:hypothetical protein|nr:hypothetical protein [Patescibacteria group bacterium]